MARIKVRFNLGRGVNYMKWKIQYPNGVIEYYNPTEIQLVLNGCQLKNYKSVSKKIFEGGNKTVCAWVLCDDIQIIKTNFTQLDLIYDKIRYNPRVQPNWIINSDIVDNQKIEVIGSINSSLYKII